MNRAFPPLHASAVLVATLLPLCVFASPLRLSDNSIPEPSAQPRQGRPRYALTQALKVEQGKTWAAQQPAPEVASAPAPSLAPPSIAPAAEAADESEVSSPVFEALRDRKQPLIVVHAGVAGLWGYGTQSYGLGAVVEPKWNITDWLAAGLRIDGGVMFGGRIVPDGNTTVALGVAAASLAKAEIFLGDTGVRPFAGFGGGMYVLTGQSVSAGSGGAGVYQSGGRYFGIAPQLGIDFGGLRLGVTYNHIIGADIVIEQNVSAGLEAERLPRNYVQLELTGRTFAFGG